VKNAKETFQVTGLEPYNSDMFSDDDFLPSDVSNWLQGRIGMRTQLVVRNCKCLCPSRRKQQRTIHLEIVFRINCHPRAVKRRWKKQEFLPQASFPYQKQK
jgi:hypothetical protein